ncbi:MAG: ATP-dependent helicase HrpB, partial [Pseudomonadota bacterium]
LVCRALGETAGDILVFLPGAGEIGRVAARLAGRTGGAALRALHGSLPFAEQRRALAAEAEGRRRIVLATAIAETSLTVEGVRVVVDAGRARRAEVNAATGLSRLVTVPVSRAEADQRRGRAGRLGPGTCYRMWTRGEEGALPAFAVPEILSADLAPLALELALWGAADPAALAFADPPPAGALAEARALLAGLGALDARGGITEHGRAIARFPAHPRLAHMVLAAQREGRGGLAARLAALLGARDPLRRDGPNPAPADLALRVAALRDPGRLEAEHPLRVDRDAVARIREEAKRLDPDAKASGGTEEAGAIAGLLTLAWPDRVALRRPGDAPRYLLANGRGAAFAPGEPLGAARLVVAVDVDDTGRDARIRLAAALTEADLRARHGPSIAWVEVAAWSPRRRRVEAETREMFGAIALARQAWRAAPPEALGAALADGIRDLGLAALPWSPAAESLRARVRWLAAQGDTMPDWSDAALLEDLDDWLTPYLAGLTRVDQIPPAVLETALATALGREHAAVLEAAAPERFATPLGGAVRIDYARAEPTLTIRVQELFGLNRHPCVGNPPIPLVLELTSPAGRPVQTTRDLPGFWAESYRDVRKDMRARYPKHPWPEDPLSASPTRRAKPRKR